MTIVHRHPVYSDETIKAEAINKKFNIIYTSIIEKRDSAADEAVAV